METRSFIQMVISGLHCSTVICLTIVLTTVYSLHPDTHQWGQTVHKAVTKLWSKWRGSQRSWPCAWGIEPSCCQTSGRWGPCSGSWKCRRSSNGSRVSRWDFCALGGPPLHKQIGRSRGCGRGSQEWVPTVKEIHLNQNEIFDTSHSLSFLFNDINQPSGSKQQFVQPGEIAREQRGGDRVGKEGTVRLIRSYPAR